MIRRVTGVIYNISYGVTGVTTKQNKRVTGVTFCFTCRVTGGKLGLVVLLAKVKIMKYPIIFVSVNNDSVYQVSVPDLPGCATNADSIDLGLEKISQSIKSHLAILAEYGEKIPSATSIDKHRQQYALEHPHTHSHAFWAIVDIDIIAYLGKSHKINVTLPELLIKQIDERVSKSSAYKTRSGFIASACLVELEK